VKDRIQPESGQISPSSSFVLLFLIYIILERYNMEDIPILSAELCDLIIDCLQDSRHVLYRCSLVSRSWVSRSRYHLFRRVELRYDSRERINMCDNLYAVVQKSPHIASLIQELYIPEGRHEKKEDWIKTTPTLPLLLASLTNLTTLKLRRIEWNDEDTEPTFRNAFRSVVASNPIFSITFEKCAFPPKSFLLILQSCPLLKHLIIRDSHAFSMPEYTKVVEEEEATQTVLHQSIQLEDLRIEQLDSLESLIIGPDTDVDFLHLRTLHCVDTRCYQTVLDEAGGSLRHLVIRSWKAASRTPITLCLGSLI
jgi:hypothetical protein